jgi:hypothetical protein
MIKPALELAQSFQALYIIADYQALTTPLQTDFKIEMISEKFVAHR